MNVLQWLRDRFAEAAEQVDAQGAELASMVQPAQDARFGDYQINAAMPLAKRLGKPPREIAQRLVEALDVSELCEPPEIAGPGFINLRLKPAWLEDELVARETDPRLGTPPASAPRTIVVDYSSPNVAKPMHVGHIRSTVIGDALYRILEFLGHRVISDNHLGDWGTQFGMIIYGFKHFVDRAAFESRPVEELARLYQLVHRLVDYHRTRRTLPQLEQRIAALRQQLEELERPATTPPVDSTAPQRSDKQRKKQQRRLRQQLEETEQSLRDARQRIARIEADTELASLAGAHAEIEQAVLDETARLHQGDAENRSLWESFMPHCKAALDQVYQRLGIRFDHEYGESFYHDRLAPLVERLQRDGLARESEGALCIFLEGFDSPMIVRKRDGAFLYATTDLATIEFRMESWSPDAILYVVDHRQGEHFAKLFAAARQIGYTEVELTHVAFGTVLGDDGRPFRTRSGDVVGLESLLDEAVARALHVVTENDDAKPAGPELSPEERQRVAEVVGIGAIKYADLSHHRTSDYVFSFDKMLALEGNTATYLQYSYARIRGIFAKGKIDFDAPIDRSLPCQLVEPIERELAVQLVRFPEALAGAVVDYTPHLLSGYLFDLAERFHKFYQQCSVLQAEREALRASRLRLCRLTARTLEQGLALLGIELVPRM